MPRLFHPPPFAGFGPSRFHLASQPARSCRIVGSRAALRRQVRLHGPQCPGVYGMLDHSGELIYVGKAKRLRVRLLSYFRPRGRDPRVGRIVPNVRAIVWEHAANEFAALLRELELIQRWQPRFNVQGQPQRRRRVFVCLGRRPAPCLFLARRPGRNLVACSGPVPGSQRARQAVRWLRDLFRLRDCPQAQDMIFADQHDLFPIERPVGCLRYEIGTCLGPCAGLCRQNDYERQVRAVQAFLCGEDTHLLAALEAKMAFAVQELAYERAAMLRDQLACLRWLQSCLERLREAGRQPTCAYRVRGHEGDLRWYVLQRGRVVQVLDRPPACLADVDIPERRAAGELEEVFLIAAWFRKHTQERRKLQSLL